MLRTSFPAGKLLGVDVRVHWSFPVLFALSAAYGSLATGHAVRGVGLWAALCFAVAVREIARAIAGAYSGLRLRGVFLLPVGGVMAFAPGKHGVTAETRWVTYAAPVANFGMGLLLLGTCYAFEPGINLFAQPWISPAYVLRSFVWTQVILGLVSLLPVALQQNINGRSKTPKSANPSTDQPTSATGLKMPTMNLGTMVALAVVIAGFVMMNQWIIISGAFMLLGAQFGSASSPASSPEAESILVREVMLTEYTLLSTSDTLGGALERTVHSLQDVFPVVRGDRLVGSVARSTIAESLQTGGDSYLQGVMTRNIQTAKPEETLVEALRRTASLGASEFIPVVEEGAMLGILTPQSLGRAVHVVKSKRPAPERDRD